MAEFDREAVIQALGILAVRRQADVSAKTLQVFAHDLEAAGYTTTEAGEACQRLGHAERRDGETAFPELGKVLRVCREVRRDQQAAHWAALAEQNAHLLVAHKNVPSLTPAESTARMRWMRAEVERVRKGASREGQ